MICPKCKNSITMVIDKRDLSSHTITRRRRNCNKCGFRFTTYERIENSFILIEKKNGKFEPFNKDKLKLSIMRSVKKHVNEVQIDHIIEKIENEIIDKNSKDKITSEDLGDMVLKELLKLDKLSYLRFASIYKNFCNLSDFQDEINKINKFN